MGSFHGSDASGYTSWHDRRDNSLRAIKLAEIDVPDAAAHGRGGGRFGIAWPVTNGEAMLPQFDSFNQQQHYIDVFNKGKTAFDFTAT